jgi:hypothetical protein
MTWILKMNAVSVSALNQWTLSLWSLTVENSPALKARSMVGLMR